jgi:hypothetical protein
LDSDGATVDAIRDALDALTVDYPRGARRAELVATLRTAQIDQIAADAASAS